MLPARVQHDLTGRLSAPSSSALTLPLLSSFARVRVRGCNKRRFTFRVLSARADRVRIDERSEIPLQIDLELSKLID